MIPTLTVACLWLLFGGTHIGMAAVRARIVARTGEVGYVVIFYLIAAASFTALVTYYAAHRFDGVAGLAVGSLAVARWPLMGVVVLGVAVMVPALISYPRLPSALFGQPIGAVRGIERITRHPFFAGVALLAGAHLLLATHLVGTVFFAGLLLLATAGAWHQDRRLMARRGRAYADYCNATSAIPFVAILAGRQRLMTRELPFGALGLGVMLALAARYGHAVLFAAGGLWIAGAVVGGGFIAGINAWRRASRHKAIRRRATHESLSTGGSS
ncbi:MAG: NnrU family protein [Candidatus Binatia bacterium]